jgi:hypothetical protein
MYLQIEESYMKTNQKELTCQVCSAFKGKNFLKYIVDEPAPKETPLFSFKSHSLPIGKLLGIQSSLKQK